VRFYTLSEKSVLTDSNGKEWTFDGGELSKVASISSLKFVDLDNNLSQNFTLVDDIAECALQENSFYYDRTTRNLFVHFANFSNIYNSVVRLGISRGFSDFQKEFTEETTQQFITADGLTFVTAGGLDFHVQSEDLTDLIFEPRLLNIPKLTKKKDPLFFGKMQYNDFTAELINTDGEFDNLSADIFSQAIRVKVVDESEPYSKAQQIYSGFVEDYKRDFDKLKINIQDKRKALSAPAPVKRFTLAEFPNMSEDLEDTLIPIAYGTVKKAKAYCINSELTLDNYTYKFMDTQYFSATGLTTAYVDGIAYNVSNLNLSAGTFDLATAIVGDGGGQEVLVDFTGSATVNALDVLKDLLLKFNNMQFLDEFFNIDEWITETAKATDIGLWLGEESSLADYVDLIMFSIQGIFDVQPDGRFTVKTYDADRPIKSLIDSYYFSDKITIDYPAKEYLSSLTVGYNQDLDSGDYTLYSDTSNVKNGLLRYERLQSKEVNTLLTNRSDAQSFSSVFMERVKDIVPTFTRTVLGLDFLGVDIMDFVACDMSRIGESEKWAVFEVIGKAPNLQKNNIEFTLRYVRDYTPIEYFYIQGSGFPKGLSNMYISESYNLQGEGFPDGIPAGINAGGEITIKKFKGSGIAITNYKDITE